MPAPALVAVDQDEVALGDVERELRDRYGRHYQVICTQSAREARDRLEDLAAAGDDVALVLAGLSLAGVRGSDLLDEVRHLHPQAKRGLLVAWGEWGDRDIGEEIFNSIARGRIDCHVVRPAESPDELFHQMISGLLLEWADVRRVSPHTIHVVGESWSGRAFELREVLERCAMPHSFCLADSEEGRAFVAEAGDGAALPLVAFPGGKILKDPSNAELAQASGAVANPERIEFDLVIVGGGPAGLSAAVYGASEGFSTLVVDEGGVGGQATASSLIRNYLGFPRGISGRHLAQQAYEQAWVFGADFSFMQTVTDLQRERDGLVVGFSDGKRVRARAVLLATGASYRRIGIPALESLNGAGVFYGAPSSEALAVAGRDVYVVGGGNSAGQAALYLSRFARSVTLVVRAQSLGAGMSHYLVRQIEETPDLHVLLATEIVGGGGNGWLEQLVLHDVATRTDQTVDASGLFLLIGARPLTEWLPPQIDRDKRGFVLTGTDLSEQAAWPLDRSPFSLETSMPGVFAAGDARHGSVKRVASAVGEGSIAIQLVHQLFAADRLHPRGRRMQVVVPGGK